MSQTSTQSSEVVEVASRWDALLDAPSRAAFEQFLPGYIMARRWYRSKAKRVQNARIAAAFTLELGPPEVARIALVDLTLDDGTRDTYVLPLAFVHGDEAAQLRIRRPQSIVLPLRVTNVTNVASAAPASRAKPRAGDEARDGLVVDALAVERILHEFLRAIARGATLEDADAVLAFHPLPGMSEAPRSGGRTVPARLVDGEQTNSSVVYGDRFVAKIVRKLEIGESAALDTGRFLTAVGYAHTPPLAGYVDVRRGDGPTSTLCLLHAFVQSEGDAWEHALRSLDPWLAAAEQRGSAPPELTQVDVLTRASEPLPSDVTEAVGAYLPLAVTLGRRIGELHVALSSRPDDARFAPEALDQPMRKKIATAVRRDLARGLDALGVHGGELTDAARTSLAAVRRRANSFAARLSDIEGQADAGVRMRVHGDLHLGQVLFTGDDFIVIDFEGEPSRSVEERRAKRSPLVDVAGMLRSFHYASVCALQARPEAARAALAPWASLWHRAVSASFLRGWLDAVKGTVVLPRERRVTRALLDLFLLEKGIYELHYEMNNRPQWVDIPLEGLREIVSADCDTRNARASTPVPTRLPAPSAPPAAAARSSPVEPSPIDPESPAVAAFLRGKATHAHVLLGAHLRQDGVTDFAVWAPHAAGVAVVGDFNEWRDTSMLAPVAHTGIFAGRARGVRPGHRYKLRITPAAGAAPFDKADPFAMSSEVSPGNASVIAPLAYAWGDDWWMENRFQGPRLDRPMSIYEVHLGSWRRKVEDGGRMLTYREIAAPLAAHAKEMGFTHVELMPLLEHPFYGSWGYGVTGFFAATSRYGSPTDLMFLVDALHQAGLGVIFDWVPAHFARDPQGLASFDGTPLFEPDDPSRAVHPTWNTGLFDFAKPEVRSFLISSAIHWIEAFHADGLRIDGVESMLYREHGRVAGGAENEQGIAFLRELTSTLKIEHPEVILAAEDSSAWPGVTRAASLGGLGFDLKWDMGFTHDMRRYLADDPIVRSQHQGLLTFRSVYAASESFVLPLSHDDVIEERGGSLLAQMHGDPWQKLANLRLLYAMTWAQPGKKLLFMGNEFAQARPWHHDRSLDWHLGHEMPHAGIARMVGDLNHVYRALPALHAGDAMPSGFEWIDGANAEMSVIAFLRRGHGDEDIVLVACNFTPVPRHQYRIGVPRGGPWREVFNSDAPIYGGSGQGNLGGVEAVPYPWNGRNCSVVVTLPPLGAIILARG